MYLSTPPAWEDSTGFSGAVDLNRRITVLMAEGNSPLGTVPAQGSLGSPKGNTVLNATLSPGKGLPGTSGMSDHQLSVASAGSRALCHPTDPATS